MDRDLKERLMKAAQIVADAAKQRASGWSDKVPNATSTYANSSGAGVIVYGAMAPSARPNQYGLRHPVFARRGTKRYLTGQWHKTPHRPFLDEAVNDAGNEALDLIEAVVDDWAAENGWNEGGLR